MADENIIIETNSKINTVSKNLATLKSVDQVNGKETTRAVVAMGSLDNAIAGTSTVINNMQSTLDGLSRKMFDLTTAFNNAASSLEGNLNRALTLSTTAAKNTKSALNYVVDAAISIGTDIIKSEIQSAAKMAITNGLIWLKIAATEVLAGNITLVGVAQSLWNVAMSSNPIGAVVTAIALFVGALAGLFFWLSGTNDQNEKLKQSFTNTADGFTEFNERLNNAKSYLSDFNDTLFASSEEQQQLKNNMQDVQKGITTICKTATTERRGYTEEEIQALDEYFKKLGELQQQQLDIANSKMDAIVFQGQKQAEQMNMSAQEYEQYTQQWIKTAQDQGQTQIDLINEQCTTELELIRQKNTENGVLNQERYDQEAEAALLNKENQVALVNEKIGSVVASYTEGYGTLTGMDELYYQKVGKNNMSLEEEDQRHVDMMAWIKENFKEGSYNYNNQIEQENKRHKDRTGEIWKDLTGSMSEEQQKQLGVWMGLSANTDLYGGKLNEKTKSSMDNLISTFESLPKDTKSVMKDAMSPMLEEMNKTQPTLFAKANTIAGGILNNLKKAFDINSPSRKVRKIFNSVMEGAKKGLDDSTSSLLNQASDIADNVLDRLKNLNASELVEKMQAEIYSCETKIKNLNASGLVQRIKAEVMASQSTIAGTVARSNYNVTPNHQSTAQNTETVSEPKYIENTIVIDGREVAKVMTPHISKRLAWEG